MFAITVLSWCVEFIGLSLGLATIGEVRTDPSAVVSETTFTRHALYQANYNEMVNKSLQLLEKKIEYLVKKQQKLHDLDFSGVVSNMSNDDEADLLTDIIVHIVVLVVVVVIIVILHRVRSKAEFLLPYVQNQVEGRLADAEIATANSFSQYQSRLDSTWEAIESLEARKIDKT